MIRKFADDKPENSNGYVWVYLPEHPQAMSNGYIYEHRLVMERAIGRFLRDNEQVQHTDGDPHNNIISNLELWIDDPVEGLIRESLSDKIKNKPDNVPEVLKKDYKIKKSSSMVNKVVYNYLMRASKM